MARECITNCPRFAECFKENESNVTWMPQGFGYKALEDFRDLAEASYDCPGPELTEVEVVKGIFRRRTEVEEQFVCQHPDETQS